MRAFYPKEWDPDLSLLFQGDMKEIIRKQHMFLTEFTGGPPLYSQEFGPPAIGNVIFHSKLPQNVPNAGFAV